MNATLNSSSQPSALRRAPSALRFLLLILLATLVTPAHAQDCGVWLPGPGSPDLPAGTSARAFGAASGDLYALVQPPELTGPPLYRLRMGAWQPIPWDSVARGSINCMTTDGGQLAVVSSRLVATSIFPATRTDEFLLSTFDGTTWTTLATRQFTFANGGPGSSSSLRFNDLTLFNGTWYLAGTSSSSGSVFSSSATGLLYRASGTTLELSGSTNSGSCTILCPDLPALRALQVGQGGLFIAGEFSSFTPSGGSAVAASHIVRFDGTTFSVVPRAPNDGIRGMFYENSIVFDANLVVWGDFTQVGTLAASRIARWNNFNQTWTAVGTGLGSAPTAVVQIQGSGGLNDIDYVAVGIIQAGGVPIETAARWTGSAWQQFGPTGSAALTGTLNAVINFGGVTIGGNFLTASGQNFYGVSRLAANTWSNVATNGTIGRARAITAFNGNVVIGGDFTRIDSVPATRLAQRNLSTGAWSAIGGGVDGTVNAVTTFGSELVVGGSFTNAGSPPLPVTNVAAWNGTSWRSLGSGLNGPVNGFTIWNGSLVAVGNFTFSGTTSVDKVARFDGSTWQPVHQAAFAQAELSSAAVLGSTLHVGGPAGVFRLNGTILQPLAGNTNGPVHTLLSYLGSLYVGGEFTTVGSPPQAFPRLARWNGSQWLGVGAAPGNFSFGSVRGLFIRNDQIVATGDFRVATPTETAVNIASYNGVQWSTLPQQEANAIILAGLTLAGTTHVVGQFDRIGLIDSFAYGQWSPAPVVVTPPANQTVCETDGTGLANFSAVFAGNPPPTLRWHRNTIPLSDSLRISGATTPNLSIGGITEADEGNYSCVATDACGGMTTSAIATLTVGCCRPDFTGDGLATAFDIFEFLNLWFASDPRANYNGTGPIDALDIFDYLNDWFAGC